jgi:hypothetical protein
MTCPKTLLAIAIRHAPDLETAVAAVNTYEADLYAAPNELDMLEALPDWLYSTLLQWQLDRGPIEGLDDAQSVLSLRSWQLVGALAEAMNQALELKDLVTAARVAHLLNYATVRTVGTASLARALRAEDYSTRSQA